MDKPLKAKRLQSQIVNSNCDAVTRRSGKSTKETKSQQQPLISRMLTICSLGDTENTAYLQRGWARESSAEGPLPPSGRFVRPQTRPHQGHETLAAHGAGAITPPSRAGGHAQSPTQFCDNNTTTPTLSSDNTKGPREPRIWYCVALAPTWKCAKETRRGKIKWPQWQMSGGCRIWSFRVGQGDSTTRHNNNCTLFLSFNYYIKSFWKLDLYQASLCEKEQL